MGGVIFKKKRKSEKKREKKTWGEKFGVGGRLALGVCRPCSPLPLTNLLKDDTIIIPSEMRTDASRSLQYAWCKEANLSWLCLWRGNVSSGLHKRSVMRYVRRKMR